MRRLAIALMVLAVSACAGGSGAVPTRTATTAARPPATTTPPSREVFRPPSLMREGGLNGVIGARAASLTSRFGQPRINLVEGDARKLQFAGRNCVLDIFLYPLEAGREPVATHVDARLRQGGSETDRAGCIAEIERR